LADLAFIVSFPVYLLAMADLTSLFVVLQRELDDDAHSLGPDDVTCHLFRTENQARTFVREAQIQALVPAIVDSMFIDEETMAKSETHCAEQNQIAEEWEKANPGEIYTYPPNPVMESWTRMSTHVATCALNVVSDEWLEQMVKQYLTPQHRTAHSCVLWDIKEIKIEN
jgi:hypothetical protein